MTAATTKKKKKINKILVIGDIHFTDRRGYADYIEDGRAGEEQSILDHIVFASKHCDKVVFLGDVFDQKNNSAAVINKMVNFLERFDDKEVFILAGNHEKWANGKSALDFLREIKGKNWHIITTEIEEHDGLVFMPFLYKNELENKNINIPKGKILFAHHAVDGVGGSYTKMLDEYTLSKDICKDYRLVVCGHIHTMCQEDNIVYTGSVFSDVAGEKEKSVLILDEDGVMFDIYPLPGRSIYNVEEGVGLENLDKGGIVKCVLTKKKTAEEMEELKAKLREFDAFVLLENYPSERRKAVVNNDVLSLEVEDMLKIYAKQNKVDAEKLIHGYKIIQSYEKTA